MQTLEITTVSLCKNMCNYCPQTVLQRSYNSHIKKMTLDTFVTCVNKVPTTVVIDFAGMAEPFLNKQCVQMIQHAANKGLTIRLYTTLVGLSIEAIDDLKDIPFKDIVLHLPDNHGIMKCKVNDQYCDVVNKFLQYFPKCMKHVYGSIHAKLSHINGIEKHDAYLHNRANNLQTYTNNYRFGKIFCGPIAREKGSVLNHNVLLPNGDVVMCCMDYQLRHCFGNLLRDSYEDLFQSAEYNNVISGMKDDMIDILCRYCNEAVQVE